MVRTRSWRIAAAGVVFTAAVIGGGALGTERVLDAKQGEIERLSVELGAEQARLFDEIRFKQRLELVLFDEHSQQPACFGQGGIAMTPVDARVVWMDSGLLIDAGKGHGVIDGMKFTVYREDKFVCTAIVTDAKHAASRLRIEPGQNEPKIGDSVSNHILLSASRPPIGR